MPCRWPNARRAEHATVLGLRVAGAAAHIDPDRNRALTWEGEALPRKAGIDRADTSDGSSGTPVEDDSVATSALAGIRIDEHLAARRQQSREATSSRFDGTRRRRAHAGDSQTS